MAMIKCEEIIGSKRKVLCRDRERERGHLLRRNMYSCVPNKCYGDASVMVRVMGYVPVGKKFRGHSTNFGDSWQKANGY